MVFLKADLDMIPNSTTYSKSTTAEFDNVATRLVATATTLASQSTLAAQNPTISSPSQPPDVSSAVKIEPSDSTSFVVDPAKAIRKERDIFYLVHCLTCSSFTRWSGICRVCYHVIAKDVKSCTYCTYFICVSSIV